MRGCEDYFRGTVACSFFVLRLYITDMYSDVTCKVHQHTSLTVSLNNPTLTRQLVRTFVQFIYDYVFVLYNIYRLRGTQRGGAAWARTLAHRVIPLFLYMLCVIFILFFASFFTFYLVGCLVPNHRLRSTFFYFFSLCIQY